MAVIWRHVTTGTVAHAFFHATDERALCGRLVLYTLGQWADGKGNLRECKACTKNLPQ